MLCFGIPIIQTSLLLSIDGFSLLVLQLQLQRNEVIALINLLNRLSESLKFVHEIGPSVEKNMGGLVPEHSAHEISSCRRIWESVIGLRY